MKLEIYAYLKRSLLSMFKKSWRIWAKAMGEKVGSTDTEADIIAVIRTAIFLSILVTNLVIVAGNIHKW